MQALRNSPVFRTAIIFASVFGIAMLVNHFSNGAFMTPGNITNVLRQITINAILASGMTLVIVTAGIDLSIGSVIALAGVSMALFANAMPFGGPALFVSTLAFGLLVGGCAGYINSIPVVGLNLPPFITTLAMMSVASGAAYNISHGRPVPINSEVFNAVGSGYILSDLLAPLHLQGIPIVVLWMAAIIATLAVVLGKTRFGRYVLAVGGNEEAARLAGVNVARIKTAVYVLSGCCAAVAGFLLMARFSSGSPQTGEGAELQAIAAVVVGGTSLMGGRGKVVGTFVGALLIGVLYNAMNLLSIESYTQKIVLGAVILLAVIVEELRKRYLASNA